MQCRGSSRSWCKYLFDEFIKVTDGHSIEGQETDIAQSDFDAFIRMYLEVLQGLHRTGNVPSKVNSTCVITQFQFFFMNIEILCRN